MAGYIKIIDINKQRKQIFNKYFADQNGNFYFEGMWLRNQRKENAKQSGWTGPETARRRYIHFYDKYVTVEQDEQTYLAVKDVYLAVSNTLPKNELEDYKSKIFNALKTQNYTKKDENTYTKNNFEVLVFSYNNHPKNALTGTTFPNNYESLDIVFKTKNFAWESHYNRMWEHSTKMFRMPDKRENPHYETSLAALKQYLPAQIEAGCGPSIEADIPPLYEMHETYKVQNHDTGKFYFANQDDLILNVILNPEQMYKKFAQVPVVCLMANHTPAYNILNQAYKKGFFIGTVYNNNFDRLLARFDIPEKILRIYDKKTYLPKIEFDKRAKSLICFGIHADRRTVQKQARAQGLKVIYVDPEGFYESDGSFSPYPIEGPKNQDIIYKMTFTEFMNKFEAEFLK